MTVALKVIVNGVESNLDVEFTYYDPTLPVITNIDP